MIIKNNCQNNCPLVLAGINAGFKHLRELKEKELKEKELKEKEKELKLYKIAAEHFIEPNNIIKLLEDIIDDGQRNYRLKKSISSCPEFANPFLIKTWKFGYKSARMKLSVKEALDKFLNQLI